MIYVWLSNLSSAIMTVMSGDPRRTEWPQELAGGAACLDFANTVNGFRGVSPRERIHAYADLVAFARHAGLVGDAQSRRLLAEARRRPADAEATLREAIALREAMAAAFGAVAGGAEPPAEALEVVNRHLSRALSRRRLRRGAACCTLAWDDDPAALDAPLWPVVASAAELLASEAELGRVRMCGLSESQECSWLFVDRTKSRTRRWCSMKDCGNVAKARRHYHRVKARE